MKDLTPDRSTLDPIEIASRDEITALQLKRLKWSLGHAYENVPLYRAKFDAAGVHPDDFTEMADLSKFPFTVKQDLRDNYPFGMFAVRRDEIVRVHASSGTTGKPTVVGYTKNDIRGLCGPRARGRGMWCISPMATASSPGASARITGRSGWAARSFPSPAA